MIYCGTNGTISCIDENTGQEAWRSKLQTGGFLNPASGGDVAILVRNGVVIAGCNGHVWGFDAATGQQLWHNGLVGLGNGFVSLCDDAASVQYVKVVKHSNG